MMVEGSGTAATLTAEVELPKEGRAPLEPLLAESRPKSAELMPSVPKRPLGISEPAKARPLACSSGLPEASLASIVTRPGLPAIPPIIKTL